MKKPWYQKIIQISLPAIVAGLLGFSSLLSAIQTTKDLIPPSLTYWGSFILIAVYIAVQIILKRNPLNWVSSDGTLVRIKTLGIIPLLMTAGILLALWIPRFSEKSTLSTPITNDATIPVNDTILFVKLSGPDNEYKLSEILIKELSKNLAISDDKIIIAEESIAQKDGELKAVELGEKYNANIIIWGWYEVTETQTLYNIIVELVDPRYDSDLDRTRNEKFFVTIKKSFLAGTEVKIIDVYNNIQPVNSFEFQQKLEENLSHVITVIKGYSAYRSNNWEVAINYFNLAIEDPVWQQEENLTTLSSLYFFRGNCFYPIGDLEKAYSDYSKTIEINPFHPQAYFGRGNIYLTRSQWENALADYTESIMLFPNYAPAYYNRGVVYKELSMFENAIQDFSIAQEIGNASTKESAELELRRLGALP